MSIIPEGPGRWVSDGDLATIRTYLASAASSIERGYVLHDKDGLVASLRTLVADLTAPEMKARQDAMRARLEASRAEAGR